jgi:formate hydrogenlyase transcriptional activator
MLAFFRTPKKEIAYMRKSNKSKEEPLQEVAKLRQKIAEYEKLEIERKKGEEARQKSDEMYKALVKTSPDAIAVYDVSNCVIEVSDTWLKMWGYQNSDEVIGKNGFEFIAPEDHEKLRIHREMILKKGYVKNIEVTFIKKDGTRFLGELSGSLIKDARGKTKSFMSAVRDITKRKHSERELKKYRKHLEKLVENRTKELEKINEQLKNELVERKQAEERYKKLVITSPDAVAVHGLNGYIIEVSHKWLKMWGYQKAEEVIGKNGFEFIAPESWEIARKNLSRLLKKGLARTVEMTMLRKDGTRFIGELNGSLIEDASGKAIAIMATTRDITERKRMENALKESRKNLQKEVKTLRRQIQKSKSYTKIIGNSSSILKVIDLIQQVARTNSTVLITGETGSGKDLIAQVIHSISSRSNSPFLEVNCGALPEHLIESELFGYVKGAFTGALQNKIGLFEEANSGTIYLNEISDLPLRLQAKLLQVLEKQQIRRLGQSKSTKIDVRIIAASNINLDDAVIKNRFRQDLFYRLNVFPIKIPPLRERKEDIPLLVKYFLDKHCLSLNKEITDISKDTMDILCSYDYPGNVRELENIIQRAIIMAQNSIFLPQYLPDKLRGIVKSGIRTNLAKVEKDMIINVIHQCKGDLDQAAEKLGYSRTTLWRKMRKLDIKRPKNFS